MYTAYVLVRNLEGAPGEPTLSPAVLDFGDFKISSIPQSPRWLVGPREIFPDARYGDWVYERSYASLPPAPGPAPSGFGGIPEEIEDVLLLLRLFKAGDLSFVRVKIRGLDGQLCAQYPYRAISEISTTFPYRMSQEECPKWNAFAQELRARPGWASPWFSVARRFFLYGGAKELNFYKEPQTGIEINEVDRIVDYTIALEATSVPEKDFVGRCLRERAALLVRKSEADRGKIKRLLRDFYDVRSTIAHGSPLSDDQRALITRDRNEFESVVRDILVEGLRNLPADEEGRKKLLQGLWRPSDADRAQKVFEDLGRIKDPGERQRLAERISGGAARPQRVGRRKSGRQRAEQVNVVRSGIRRFQGAAELAQDAAHVNEKTVVKCRGNQRLPVLGAEDHVGEQVSIGMGHGLSPLRGLLGFYPNF